MEKTKETVISRRKFAIQCGVQHSAINLAAKRGKLDLIDDKVDLRGRNTRAYIDTQRRRLAGESKSTAPIGGAADSATSSELENADRPELERQKLLRQISHLERVNRRADVEIERAQFETSRATEDSVSRSLLTKYFDHLWTVQQTVLRGAVDRVYPKILELCPNDGSDLGFCSRLYRVMTEDADFAYAEIGRQLKRFEVNLSSELNTEKAPAEEPTEKEVSDGDSK
jgi:hypothetical protein